MHDPIILARNTVENMYPSLNISNNPSNPTIVCTSGNDNIKCRVAPENGSW